jgi:hypothetical protein
VLVCEFLSIITKQALSISSFLSSKNFNYRTDIPQLRSSPLYISITVRVAAGFAGVEVSPPILTKAFQSANSASNTSRWFSKKKEQIYNLEQAKVNTDYMHRAFVSRR